MKYKILEKNEIDILSQNEIYQSIVHNYKRHAAHQQIMSWFVYEKIGQSFCWRRWAEGAGACPSGDNAGLPILGLRHSLRPEWKHGITGLR